MKFQPLQFLKSHWITLFAFILSIAGFIHDWQTFYPGFMSPDTLDQYTQAHTHSYNDWHPPVMSFLWRLLLPIKDGLPPMLFLQLFLLWASFFLLVRILLRVYPFLFFLAILFILSAYVQNFAGDVWKDVQMTQSWFFASMIMASVFYKNRKMNWFEALLSFLAICYGCWLRVNALPGILPLFAFWVIACFGLPKWNWKQSLLFATKVLSLTFLCIILQMSITRFIIKPSKSYIEYKLFVQDLSSIYLKTGDFSFPEFIRNDPSFDTLYLRKNYKIYTFDQFWWNEDNKQIFPFNLDDKKMSEVRSYWLHAIYKHPIAYAKIKARGSLYFLRIFNSGTHVSTFFPYIHPNSFGFSYTPNEQGESFIKWMYEEENSIYMKPWFWALANVCVVLLCFLPLLKRIRPVVLCICLSSLFYLVAQFFVFPADTELRYFYWNGIAVTVGAIFIISEIIYSIARKISSQSKIKI